MRGRFLSQLRETFHKGLDTSTPFGIDRCEIAKHQCAAFAPAAVRAPAIGHPAAPPSSVMNSRRLMEPA
jgi:hypothetical protein